MWEFPGRPVVMSWHFHCWGQIRSLIGELRSRKLCRAAKEKKGGGGVTDVIRVLQGAHQPGARVS